MDGKAISVKDLNSRNYDIRWYVFKIQDDGWHVDGKLIRKKTILPKTGGNGNSFLYFLGIFVIVLASKIKREVINENY